VINTNNPAAMTTANVLANQPGSTKAATRRAALNPAVPVENAAEAVLRQPVESAASNAVNGSHGDFDDADAMTQSMNLLRSHFQNQPGAAMSAQANLSPESVLNLLS
jgi:hypothetical protein